MLPECELTVFRNIKPTNLESATNLLQESHVFFITGDIEQLFVDLQNRSDTDAVEYRIVSASLVIVASRRRGAASPSLFFKNIPSAARNCTSHAFLDILA